VLNDPRVLIVLAILYLRTKNSLRTRIANNPAWIRLDSVRWFKQIWGDHLERGNANAKTFMGKRRDNGLTNEQEGMTKLGENL
jgi:hypothetical protein